MKTPRSRKWKAYCECGEKKKHNPQHDAYYCQSCDKWLERQCKDLKCEFCADRPERPSMLMKVGKKK